MSKNKPNVLQLNNSYIQEERSKRRSLSLERKRKNRLMGMILILVIFLFTLPAYNLMQSYEQLLEKRTKLAEMKTNYQVLEEEVAQEQLLVKKMTDKDYAAKYVRAKYHYSKEGEFVYTIPSLLPR